MSEIDNLVVSLDVDASGVKKGVTEANQALGQSTQNVDKLYQGAEKVEKAYNKMGAGAGEAARKIQVTQAYYQRIANTLEDYKRKLELVVAKEEQLNAQRQAVASKPDHYSGKYEALEKIDKELSKVIDKEIEYGSIIDMLGERFSNLEVSAKAVTSGGEGMSRMLVNMGANAAVAMAKISGADGLASGLQVAASSISSLMLATNPAGVAIAAFTTGMTLISTIVGVINEKSKEAEERIKSVKEVAAQLKNTESEVASAAGYIATLKQSNQLISEQLSAKQALASIFPEIVLGYTDEGRAIYATNDAIREYIDALNEKARLERADQSRQADSALADVADKYRKIRNEVASLGQETAAATDLMNPEEIAKRAIEANEKVKESALELSNAEIEFMDTWKQSKADIVDNLGELDGVQKAIANETLLEFANLNKERIYGVELIENENEKLAARRELEAELVDAMRENINNRDLYNEKMQQTAALYDSSISASESFATATDKVAFVLDKAQKAADLTKWRAYVNEVKNGQKGTEAHNKALAEMAKFFNVSEKAIQSNIGVYAGLIEKLKGASEEEYNLAIAAIDTEINVKKAALGTEEVGSATYDSILKQVNALMMLRDAAATVLGDLSELTDGEVKPRRSGGGGSRKSEQEEAWKRELELINEVKSGIEDLGDSYATVLEKMIADERLSAEGRADAEKQLKMAMEMNNGDMYNSYIDFLGKLKEAHAGNADAIKEIDKQMVQAIKDNHKQVIEELDSLANAVKDALRAQIEQMRDAEVKGIQEATAAAETRYKAEIDGINAARDAQIAALNAEIKLLDEQWKLRQRMKEDEDDSAALARLQKEQAHTQDAYKQRQLQAAIERKEAEITEKEEKRQYEDKKKALQDQIAAVRDSAQAQITAINEMMAADKAAFEARQASNDAYWEKRLSDEVLNGETLVFLQEKTQEEIIELLEKYNPEYLTQGQQLGQMLYQGFDEKYVMLLDRTKKVATDIVLEANRAIAAWREMQRVTSTNYNSYSSPTSSSAQSFAAPMQSMYDGLNAVSDAIEMSMFRMVEPRINYYEAQQQQAFANGATSYSRIDTINGNTARMAAYGTNIEKLEVNQTITTPGTSAYEQQREAKRNLQRII